MLSEQDHKDYEKAKKEAFEEIDKDMIRLDLLWYHHKFKIPYWFDWLGKYKYRWLRKKYPLNNWKHK